METGSTRSMSRVVVRLDFLSAVVFLLFLLLGLRYFHIMVGRHDEYRAMERAQSRQVETIRAFRGSLLDRMGRDLALTQTFPSIAVDPSKVPPDRRSLFAADLAKVLHVEAKSVLAELGKDSSFRWIKRLDRDPGVRKRLAALGWGDAIVVREELARSYPNGKVGAQLVGLTNVDGKGVAGLEKAFDAELAPRPGRRVVLRDGWTSRRISTTSSATVVPPENGEDVKLAMDLTIQSFADEALDRAVKDWRPKTAVAVVLDPRNGDVLALASRPTFDPDRRKTITAAGCRIRAVTDRYPIGSTIKPLVAAEALDEGVVSYGETFDVTRSGVWRFKGRTIHDHGHGLGVIPFPEIIIRSSNIGAAQIGLRLGMDRMWRLFSALGFRKSTGSGIPGETGGSYRDRKLWTKRYTLCSVSFGQEIALTPLEFTTAFASLVNGGVLYRPRVAIAVGGRSVPPMPRRQVFSPDIVKKLMVPILVRVVEEGTGKNARIPGYFVGGKTGTAQKLDARGRVVGYVSSFIGFAPAESPRFLVFVTLNEPSRKRGTPYGGSCAAPAVKSILEKCLKYAEIPPDRPGEITGRR